MPLNRSRSGFAKRTALSLCAMTIALSACAIGSTDPGPVVVSDYCRIAAPIGYDSKVDSPETVKAIEDHNSRWACTCENDCPR